MAHNQDRLQNSDSSVVYGHGHIIYDSDSGDVGDTPLRQAIKQPTMSLNGPLQKHISLLANASSSSSSSSSAGVSSDCPSFGFLYDGELLWIMG